MLPVELKEVSFLGIDFYVPDDVEKNLAENFGNWRQSDPEYISHLQSPSTVDVGGLVYQIVGRLRELGWAATFLASPYARFISGHTLVVDGANWQRRFLTNAPVVTVRDQMGRGPFAPG